MKYQNKKQLAEMLKQKRISAGLSQRDVANEFGYSTPQFISNWERGESHPPVESLKKIGELYNVSSELLFEAMLSETIHKIKLDLSNKFRNSKSRL